MSGVVYEEENHNDDNLQQIDYTEEDNINHDTHNNGEQNNAEVTDDNNDAFDGKVFVGGISWEVFFHFNYIYIFYINIYIIDY